jgi:protein-tyrosine kinase
MSTDRVLYGVERASAEPETVPGNAAAEVRARSIGDIISQLRNLSVDEVERILELQRTQGVRFGEAAVSLGLASQDDVLFALSQQFHYPYAPQEQRTLSPELVTMNEPFGARAEAFRALRSQLIMRDRKPAKAQALAIISPCAGDGKTYCAANLGVVLAQLGGRTLIVDADMRAPRMHEVFNLGNRPMGLSSILSGRSTDQVICQAGNIPSLFVLPVGATPPNPLELLERPAFGLLIEELASKFDHVIVDSPAAEVGADAGVIAARCGKALIVARRHHARIDALSELTAGFVGSPATLTGVVVNDF